MKIGQSAAKYLNNKKLLNSFIKDRGSTTIISNPTKNPRREEYLKLCYLED